VLREPKTNYLSGMFANLSITGSEGRRLMAINVKFACHFAIHENGHHNF
jgi:hypothetical protein